jgi:hypothetical protein
MIFAGLLPGKHRSRKSDFRAGSAQALISALQVSGWGNVGLVFKGSEIVGFGGLGGPGCLGNPLINLFGWAISRLTVALSMQANSGIGSVAILAQDLLRSVSGEGQCRWT